MRFRILATIVSMTTIILTGCILGGAHDIEARVNVESKKFSVVPFREKDLYLLLFPTFFSKWEADTSFH